MSSVSASDAVLSQALIELVRRHAASVADPSQDLLKALSQTSEWDRAIVCLRGHARAAQHIDQLIGTADSVRRCEAEDLLCGFLLEIRQVGKHATDAATQFVVDAFLSFISNDTLTSEWRSPAFGIIGEPGEYPINDRTRLLVLDDQHGMWEIARLLGKDSLDSPDSHHTTRCTAFLVTRYTEHKRIGHHAASITRTVDRTKSGADYSRLDAQLFVEACRVVSPCCVATPFLCAEPLQWLGKGRSIQQSINGIPWRSLWRTFRAESQSLSTVSRVMSLIEGLRQDSPLRRAITWYCKGCEHVDLGDSLIAHAIAAESLFLTGEQGEILFRLRQRIAITLGQTIDERHALHKDVGDIYGTRSAIVHGSASEPDKVAEHAQKLETIVQRMLMRELFADPQARATNNSGFWKAQIYGHTAQQEQ